MREISDLRSWPTNAGGRHVEADVDGEPLWFASDDAMLTPSSEAFASALLMPAAAQGEPLEIYRANQIGPGLKRVPAILHRAKEWWQLPGTRIMAADVARLSPAKPRQNRAMLFGRGNSISCPYMLKNSAFHPRLCAGL